MFLTGGHSFWVSVFKLFAIEKEGKTKKNLKILIKRLTILVNIFPGKGHVSTQHDF